jgi:hypothetical protein
MYELIWKWHKMCQPKAILKEEKTMPEIIVELKQTAEANAPKPGARDIVIENVVPQYNNVGDQIVYVQFGYTHKGSTFHWGLTYKLGDKKLNRLFPKGSIDTTDIGKTVKVEIQYCDSKNGEYPSIVDLDD